jgi:hypothetical protein
VITLNGVALVGELVAAACLAIALVCFAKWRVTSWLVCCVVATLALIAAALVVIQHGSI